MSAWLPWILFAAVVLIAPVLLRFCADDHPRNDGDDSEPALVT
jgi:hypothetical protein